MKDKKLIFFPKPENVFKDTSLQIYFRPLLSTEENINNQTYQIHLLSTDGLFCEKQFKFSENNFFGFKYNNGLYDFLGDLSVFKNYDKIKPLYDYLILDFQDNDDQYLREKVNTSAYIEKMAPLLEKLDIFEDLSYAKYYVEAFYSYEFTKRYHTMNNLHRHISEITANFRKNTDPILFTHRNALNILDEYFINIEYHLDFDYNIDKAMFIAGTDSARFMSINGGRSIFSMLDISKEIVYILEYW